jgi:hypothetical protein
VLTSKKLSTFRRIALPAATLKMKTMYFLWNVRNADCRKGVTPKKASKLGLIFLSVGLYGKCESGDADMHACRSIGRFNDFWD